MAYTVCFNYPEKFIQKKFRKFQKKGGGVGAFFFLSFVAHYVSDCLKRGLLVPNIGVVRLNSSLSANPDGVSPVIVSPLQGLWAGKCGMRLGWGRPR